jgi:hypothetical protein
MTTITLWHVVAGSGRRPPHHQRKSRTLFDHLVGAGQEHCRHFEAKGICGFEVDNKLEFSGLLYRNVGGFGSFQHLDHL